MALEQDRIHIFPIQGNGRAWRTSHCTDRSGMCWCKPEEKQLCTEANDSGDCKATCWRCAGEGLIDAHDPEGRIFIVHKKTQLSDAMTYFCASCGRGIKDYTRVDGAFCRSCKKVTKVRFEKN